MQAEHVLTSREDILKFLRRHPEGVHLKEIQDSYENAEKDVERLKAAGKIIAWKHWETEKWIMYPKARGSSDPVVDEDVVAEWLKQPVRAVLDECTIVHSPVCMSACCWCVHGALQPSWCKSGEC